MWSSKHGHLVYLHCWQHKCLFVFLLWNWVTIGTHCCYCVSSYLPRERSKLQANPDHISFKPTGMDGWYSKLWFSVGTFLWTMLLCLYVQCVTYSDCYVTNFELHHWVMNWWLWIWGWERLGDRKRNAISLFKRKVNLKLSHKHLVNSNDCLPSHYYYKHTPF